MRFSMKIHYENDSVTTLVSILILFGGILAGCLAVKKDNSGLISLNQTLKSGVGISLVYVLITMVWIILLTNVLEPTFWDTAAELGYEAAKQQDPEAMGNVSFEDFKPFISWLKWGIYPISIAFSLFIGFMSSLLIGLLIKKSE